MSIELKQPMIKVWGCKIGGRVADLSSGADSPMRQAIQRAFFELTGEEAEFIFSGWGKDLSDTEIKVAYPQAKYGFFIPKKT